MRVSSVSIKSFGALRDRSYSFTQFTVMHGPNESGKTSVMEAIRRSLSPTGKRDVYPAKDASDSVSVTYEEGGEAHSAMIAGKNARGETPACLRTVNPDLYRSVFAMGPSDLDDDGPVTSGEVSSKMLTIPGGDRVPEAAKILDGTFAECVGEKSNSRSALNELNARLADVDRRLESASEKESSYSALASERAELESRLVELRGNDPELDEQRRIWGLYRAQRANYNSLAATEREIGELGDFRHVSAEDIVTQASLETSLAKARGDLDKAKTARPARYPGGAKPEAVSARSKDIRRAVDGYEGYLDDRRARPAQPASKGRFPAIAVIGIALAVIGLAGCLITIYSAALAVAGIAVCVVGLVRRPAPAVAEDPAQGRARAYESRVRSLVLDLGCKPAGTDADVGLLRDILAADEARAPSGADVLEATQAYQHAKSMLDGFYMAYAGKEGFKDAQAKTEAYNVLATRRETLVKAIRDSGLDPGAPVCPVAEPPAEDGSKELLVRRIGEIAARMDEILESGDAAALRSEKAALEDQRCDLLVRGATALLASRLLDDACADLYAAAHPGVFSDADRYLSEMTCGRYRIVSDPREKDPLRVVGDDGSKSLKQCSSGLRAQALLSLKLAVAAEMSGGEVPVILDDVLLVFDTERKSGAVRALLKASERMQILMFTCDDQTAEMCRAQGIDVQSM